MAPKISQEDEDDCEIRNQDQEDPLADWEGLTVRSRRNNNLTVIEDVDALGNRSADRYDWSAHVGTRTTLTWDQTKLSSPSSRPRLIQSRESFMILWLITTGRNSMVYIDPPQLLVNCDGKAGTGRIKHTL